MEIRIIMSNGKASIYVNNYKFDMNIIPSKQRAKLKRLLEDLTNYIRYIHIQGF